MRLFSIMKISLLRLHSIQSLIQLSSSITHFTFLLGKFVVIRSLLKVSIGSLFVLDRIFNSLRSNCMQQENHNLTLKHELSFKQSLRYFNDHSNLALVLGQDPARRLKGYVNASHANNKMRRFTETWIFYYMRSLIFWHSSRQTNVILSITLAKFCVLTLALNEVLWLKKLIHFFELLENDDSTSLYTNSENVITHVFSSILQSKIKWLNLRYFRIRQVVKERWIKLIHISRMKNFASDLIKFLVKSSLNQFISRLCLQSID